MNVTLEEIVAAAIKNRIFAIKITLLGGLELNLPCPFCGSEELDLSLGTRDEEFKFGFNIGEIKISCVSCKEDFRLQYFSKPIRKPKRLIYIKSERIIDNE